MFRTNTKEGRDQVRSYAFKRLIDKGYTHEQYKPGLDIFIKDEGLKFYLVAYWGTSAKPLYNVYCITQDQRTRKVESIKANWDSHTERKVKAKSEGKQLSGSAQCAQAVRDELKKEFPGIVFSVKSENYSMGDNVNVRWSDGPTTKEVDAITDKYQAGHFDGMTDMYEYSNSRRDIPQTKYLFTSRSMSEATKATLEARAQELGLNDSEYRSENVLYRIYQKTSFPAGAIITGIEQVENTNGVHEDFYYITSNAIERKETAPNFEKVETVPGQLNIVDYSEKAFAVIGDTWPIKDVLDQLGGKYNKWLKCGSGYIFSKKRLEAVTAKLNSLNKAKEGLKDEVEKTVNWFAEMDVKETGQVSEGTKEIALVQGVKLLKMAN